MSKVPEYTKRAIDNYRKTHDVFTMHLPKGYKKEISSRIPEGISMTAFVIEAINEKLERDGL